MAKVYAITNRKGGCGKSFTVASLGAGLARQGKKVLCIDADNSHSLTISMGVEHPELLEISTSTIISDIINKRSIDPKAGIIHHSEGVDLMPANSSLTGMELALASMIGRETILRQYVSKIRPLYDAVLIDTCPSMDLLALNALAAADKAIIPVVPKYLDAKGLELLLKSIAQIQEFINPNLTIGGILLTMVDLRTNLAKEIIKVIDEAYGEKIHIFKNHVPHSIRAAEACATGKSIFEYDPNGKVAAAYASLTKELLSKAVSGIA